MKNLPKPQPCGQSWLAMQPTANGRLCGQCDKEIYDFSGMAWPAIARTQAEHGNALCGMYAPDQLKHWGRALPVGACAKLAAATTLALALSTIPAIPAVAQTPGGRMLSGTVTALSAKGKPEPLPFATVLLAGTNIGISTDAQGHYELAIPTDQRISEHATIQFISLGFAKIEWPLPPQSEGPLQHDAQMAPDPNSSITVFSVRKPSLPERAKWALKRWFSRGQASGDK